MKNHKKFVFHAAWPKEFSLLGRKIVGRDNKVILAGYLEHPGDPSQTLRAELHIQTSYNVKEVCTILDSEEPIT